jgi:hypothetical protein
MVESSLIHCFPEVFHDSYNNLTEAAFRACLFELLGKCLYCTVPIACIALYLYDLTTAPLFLNVTTFQSIKNRRKNKKNCKLCWSSLMEPIGPAVK